MEHACQDALNDVGDAMLYEKLFDCNSISAMITFFVCQVCERSFDTYIEYINPIHRP